MKQAAPRLPPGATAVPVSATFAPPPILGVPANSNAIVSATAVVFAPPELVTPASDQVESKDEPNTGWRKKEGWGKKVKPPSMVLDEDVNGFKSHQKRKGPGGGGGKKGRKVSADSKLSPHLIDYFRTKICSPLPFGTPWNSTIPLNRTTTTNISTGNNVTALSELLNALQRGSVHGISKTKAVTKPTQGVKMNALARLVCSPFLIILYHFCDGC